MDRVSRERRSRLFDVFPRGLDSSSSGSRCSYTLASDQLFERLTDHYDPKNHVEYITVKCAWYGKHQKSAKHEFILLEVEDPVVPLKNYIVLDRNNTEFSPKANGQNRGIISSVAGSSSSSRGLALDAFRVSTNGVELQLLDECQLNPRRYLEKIQFHPEHPLYLYQLVTLVEMVSRDKRSYDVAKLNCYWFAGFIWECMGKIRQTATISKPETDKRGKFGPLRYLLDDGEIEEACRSYKVEIEMIEDRLAQDVERWRGITGDQPTIVPYPIPPGRDSVSSPSMGKSPTVDEQAKFEPPAESEGSHSSPELLSDQPKPQIRLGRRTSLIMWARSSRMKKLSLISDPNLA